MVRALIAGTLMFALVVGVRADYVLFKIDLARVNVANLLIKDGPDEKSDPLKGDEQWVYGQLEIKDTKATKASNVSLDTLSGLQIVTSKGKAVVSQIVVPRLPYVDYHELKRNAAAEFVAEEKKGKNLNLAKLALARGLRSEFHRTMAALPESQKAVQAYKRVQAELKKAPTVEDPALVSFFDDLRKEEFKTAVSDRGHFSLLFLPESDGSDPGIVAKLNRLEDAFENFFYWFALQENVPQPSVPNHRLGVLLTNEFDKRHVVFGSPPLTHAGFLARRDNLLVLAPRPLDELFVTLDKDNHAVRQGRGLKKDGILDGSFYDLKSPDPKNFVDNVKRQATIQVLHLAQRALEEESHLATLTHLGTQQLLGATGLVPRNLDAPDWVRHGWASFFESAPGSLHTVVGAANLPRLAGFRKHVLRAGAPGEVLLSLVNDRYFRQAWADDRFLREMEKKDADPALRARQARIAADSRELALASAWAFVYFLDRAERMPQLVRYCEKLAELPRDLELPERASQARFASAFGVADASDPRRLDPAKLNKLATDWFAEMSRVHFDGQVANFRTPKAP